MTDAGIPRIPVTPPVRNAPTIDKSKINCPICNHPIDLDRDRYADDNGKTVHETCYVRGLIGPSKEE